MAKGILIANWKNHPESLDGSSNLLRAIAKNSALYRKLNLFIAPPLVYFESVASRAKSFAQLACQDLALAPKGSQTGLVTIDILKSFGVRLAILGHSERRAMGETDREVSEKVKFALRSGLMPLVCVGEKTRDDEGEHLEFLRRQIKYSLEGVKRGEDLKKLMIAYEPVWAIGKRSKDALGAADLAQSIVFIRKVLSDLFGRAQAERIPILYGGSVEAGNAEELFNKTGIRGFLVGHASLSNDSFSAIARALV